MIQISKPWKKNGFTRFAHVAASERAKTISDGSIVKRVEEPNASTGLHQYASCARKKAYRAKKKDLLNSKSVQQKSRPIRKSD